MRRTSIERYAAEKNLAVVMPAVGRSFYQDAASGARYWTFLSEELPALCERYFPLSTAREERFAAGLSMGGYGAMRLALARPDRYAAAASLSGALDLSRRLREAGKPSSLVSRAEYIGLFGPELQAGDADLWPLAERLGRTDALRPKLFLCCGSDDPLLAESRAFRDHLAGLRLEATYEESPGAHEWGYWDAQIQRVLAWL
jgi:S-formylglutathione hydrolase FrmB